MEPRTIKTLNLIIFSLLTVGMIIATFFDYQISMWAMEQTNISGDIFNFYAEMSLSILIFAAIALLITLISFYFFSKENSRKIVTLLIVSLVLIIFSNVFNHLIKIFFGRVRPRDLSEYYRFTIWFIPQGHTGHTAFFSGHVVAAANLLVILFIPDIFKNAKVIPYKIAVTLITIIVLSTAYSRMVVGAHYLSDVVFSLIVVYGMILLIKKYLLSKILEKFSLT